MSAQRPAVAVMVPPQVTAEIGGEVQTGTLVDIQVDPFESLAKVELTTGTLQLVPLADITSSRSAPYWPTPRERKELEAALKTQHDIAEVMATATREARTKAACLGWMVGMTTTGWPIEVPGCPILQCRSWTPDGTSITVKHAVSALSDLVEVGSVEPIAEGLTIPEKTLYEHRTRYTREGSVSLIHGRQGKSRLDEHDDAPTIRAFVFQEAERQAETEVRISKKFFVKNVYLAAVRAKVMPKMKVKQRSTNSTYRLLRKYAREAHSLWALNTSHSQRATRAISSKSAAPDVDRESVPFASIEIDATPHDSYCLDENGRKCDHVEKLSAYDAASGAYLDSTFINGYPTARDVADFILQMAIRLTLAQGPRLLTPGRLRAVSLSRSKTDRGSNMVAAEATELLAALGIVVIAVAPGRGDLKGRVESGQGKINGAAQLVPGYHGPSRRNAAPFDPSKRYLAINVAQAYERAVGHRYYNLTPKKTLRVPGFKPQLTPQMYIDAYQRVLPLPDQGFPMTSIKRALESFSGVMTSTGLQFDQFQYVLPPGAPKPVFAAHTKQSSGNRVTFYPIGRQPECLIVEAIGAQGETIDLVLLRRDVARRESGRDVTDMLAQGIDLESMEETSRESKITAEDNLDDLAMAADELALRPSPKKVDVPPPSEKPASTSQARQAATSDYEPTSIPDSEEWIRRAQEYRRTREDPDAEACRS